MDIKYNILFFVDKEGSKEKGYQTDGKVRMRIRYIEGKIDFNIGYRVQLDKWNTETQRCKAGTTHSKKKIAASEINKEIQRLENLAIEVFKTFEVADTIPSLSDFRNTFNQANGKTKSDQQDKSKELYLHFDDFTQEMGLQNNWALSTFEKFSTLKKHLRGFNDNLSYEDLTEQTLTHYVNYLRDRLQMRNSTINKNLSFIRWFLRWSIRKGYTTNLTFESFRPKLKTTEKKVIFLDWEELTQLRNYEIPSGKQYLERVRDVFLFQCYTSLRYSDVYNLRKSDVKENSIEITTIKTGDSLVIELNDYSRSILAKYKEFHFEQEKALPVISNQKMNDYLKELGQMAGIDQPIRETYHKGNERIDEVHPKYKLLGTHAGR